MKPANALVEAMLSHPPEAIAITDGGSMNLTYHDLLQTIASVVEQLHREKVTGLAICGDNSIAQVVLDIASLQAGIWTLQIPPFFTRDQTFHALKQTGCLHMASDTAPLQASSIIQQSESFIVAGREMILSSLLQARNYSAVPDKTAKVTFTSGSTSQPKGLCLSSEHLLAPVTAIAAELDSLNLERHLSVLPQAVLLETVAGIYTSLLSGSCCVIPSLQQTSAGGNPGESLRNSLDNHRARTAILVPELLHQLVEACERDGTSPSALRFLAVGGSRVSTGLLQRASDVGLPVFEGYGLSEAGSVVTLNLPGANKPGTVGRVLSHQQISISHNDEILLSEPGFLGYSGSIDENSTLDVSVFRTGDAGFIDADGYLTINGRLNNILITSMGRNVSPEWVESVMLDQPAIRQVLVFGDAQATLSALVVSNQPPDKIQLAVSAANLTLPSYARVHQWHQVEPFTQQNGFLTASGKLKRQTILEQAGACEQPCNISIETTHKGVSINEEAAADRQ